MKKFRLLGAVGAILLLTLAPQRAAHAQWNAYDAMMSNNSYSRGWVNPYNNTLSNMYRSNMITQNAINSSMIFNSTLSMRMVGGMSAGRRARLKAMPKRERTEAERFAKYSGTMYKAAKLDTPAKVAGIFAKNLGAKTSDLQPVMVELLKLYQSQAKKQGAPSTDLARTMAYCIANNYYYFTGGTGVPETQVAALRGKLRTALSEDPKFRKMTNAQKQELNESMVILTHFAALGFEVVAPKAGADKKQQVREGYKKLAGVNLRGILGVDPSRVAFDKSGLVIKPA